MFIYDLKYIKNHRPSFYSEEFLNQLETQHANKNLLNLLRPHHHFRFDSISSRWIQAAVWGWQVAATSPGTSSCINEKWMKEGGTGKQEPTACSGAGSYIEREPEVRRIHSTYKDRLGSYHLQIEFTVQCWIIHEINYIKRVFGWRDAESVMGPDKWWFQLVCRWRWTFQGSIISSLLFKKWLKIYLMSSLLFLMIVKDNYEDT